MDQHLSSVKHAVDAHDPPEMNGVTPYVWGCICPWTLTSLNSQSQTHTTKGDQISGYFFDQDYEFVMFPHTPYIPRHALDQR